jgi:hypothetical protein
MIDGKARRSIQDTDLSPIRLISTSPWLWQVTIKHRILIIDGWAFHSFVPRCTIEKKANSAMQR